jgi:hypothetical protein
MSNLQTWKNRNLLRKNGSFDECMSIVDKVGFSSKEFLMMASLARDAGIIERKWKRESIENGSSILTRKQNIGNNSAPKPP